MTGGVLAAFARPWVARATRRFAAHGMAFQRLLASDALLRVALMVGQVTVPWWVATHGGAAQLAIYGVVVSIAMVVGMPALSPLGDRHAKGRLMALAIGVHALSSAGIALMATLKLYSFPLLVGLAALNMFVTAVVFPLTTSLVSELVTPALMADALSVQQSAQAIGRLIGPAVGGVVLASLGTAPALWLHSALLLASAWLALQLPRSALHSAGKPATAATWWKDLRDGLRANWAIPIERSWTLVNSLSWLFLYPALTMLVPLKVQSLHLSAFWLGCCEATLSLGMLSGALGLSSWAVRRFGRYHTRLWAASAQGAALALVGFTSQPVLLALGFWLTGLTNSAMALVGLTHRTLARPKAFRARMYAGATMTIQLAGTLGPAVAGIALARWSVQTIYTSFGLLASAISLALAFVPGFKAFMALEPERVDGWYGRAHPEAFPPETGAVPLID